jgi:hypothetical protein
MKIVAGSDIICLFSVHLMQSDNEQQIGLRTFPVLFIRLVLILCSIKILNGAAKLGHFLALKLHGNSLYVPIEESKLVSYVKL